MQRKILERKILNIERKTLKRFSQACHIYGLYLRGACMAEKTSDLSAANDLFILLNTTV